MAVPAGRSVVFVTGNAQKLEECLNTKESQTRFLYRSVRRPHVRIPSEKENPERRRLWICASVPGENKQWQPSKYTRLCSEHFIKGAKYDDPLSPDWVQSIFSHIPATKKRKREKDMERYEQHSRMKNKRVEEKKKKDAVDVLLDLSSVPDAGPAPPAVDEQQCDNKPCKENIARLQRECNDFREKNRKLKDIIKSGTFDELAFEKDDDKVKAMTGIPTYSKLQVVLTFMLPFLQTGTNLSPVQQLLLTLMRLKLNLPLSLPSQFQLPAEHLETPLKC
ncbi:inosine triphosphate pyrophosphatase isoform X2 [Gadus macrocephalus]|uniref:inosine triphosphate pyrophosphatase isoform X2 n=1 Tax=Gadus macrocephalus TaxID=80720 RepID=UPI0028CB6B39|nr:inosine triphosphate pyrophosphatase isoform X2 [Gadus macrocephalus]